MEARVEIGGRLVEDQQRRVGQKGAGERDAPHLTSAQSGAVLTHRRVVAPGQLGDELLGQGVTGGGSDIPYVGLGSGEADIGRDGIGKEMGALGNPRDGAPPVVGIDNACGHAAGHQTTAVGFDEAQHDPRERALAGAGRPTTASFSPGSIVRFTEVRAGRAAEPRPPSPG